MENSKIAWTDNTWNIAVGCSKVSEGCKYCYMMRDFGGRRKWDVDGTVTKTAKGTFNKPLDWQKKGIRSPSGGVLKVFTSSLTDVFHEACDHFRSDMWDIIRQCPDLMFQILTKRPERIFDNLPPDWGNGWNNVALGVSVETQERGKERIQTLSTIPSMFNFVSFEPLLEEIDVWNIPGMGCIDWAIIGGESGNESGKWKYRECRFEWITKLIHDLKYGFGSDVFVKQLGTWLANVMNGSGYNVGRHGDRLENLPEQFETINLQEMPTEWR